MKSDPFISISTAGSEQQSGPAHYRLLPGNPRVQERLVVDVRLIVESAALGRFLVQMLLLSRSDLVAYGPLNAPKHLQALPSAILPEFAQSHPPTLLLQS